MTRLNLRLNSGLAAIYLFLNAAGPIGAVAAEPIRAAPPAAPRRVSSPLLWKVEGPQTSWFFGTVHSDDPLVAKVPPAVAAALDASRSFHPELALDAALGPALASRMFRSDTPALSSRLTPALWQRVERAGAALGLPGDVLERLRPAIAALLFSAPPALDIAGTLDGQLYARAEKRRLTITPLETPEQQLAIFEKLPERHAIAALAEALDEVESGRPHQKKLLAAYASGDERALATLMAAEFNRSDVSRALAEPLLFARNRAMAEALARHLATGGAFVAIGAGHLVGPRSVLELLRARGWKIARVAAP